MFGLCNVVVGLFGVGLFGVGLFRSMSLSVSLFVA